MDRRCTLRAFHISRDPATISAGFMHLRLSLTSLHDDDCFPLSCGGGNRLCLWKAFPFPADECVLQN
ncbi:hypothetical protein KC354_g28 [Hortaea werneckii]|nr:hypothetical protein KC354_g28 [Hortaea werneckii]